MWLCDAIFWGVVLSWVRRGRGRVCSCMRKKGTRNSLKPFLVRSVWANWIVRDLLEFYPDPSVWQLSRSSAYFVEDFLNVFQCCRWHFARLVVELGRMVKDKEQIHSKLGLRKILCWFIANLWEFAPTHAYSLGNFDPSNKYTFEGTRLRELETISYLNEFIGFYWFYFWINKDLCEDEFEPFYYTYLHTGSHIPGNAYCVVWGRNIIPISICKTKYNVTV